MIWRKYYWLNLRDVCPCDAFINNDRETQMISFILFIFLANKYVCLKKAIIEKFGTIYKVFIIILFILNEMLFVRAIREAVCFFAYHSHSDVIRYIHTFICSIILFIVLPFSEWFSFYQKMLTQYWQCVGLAQHDGSHAKIFKKCQVNATEICLISAKKIINIQILRI